VLLTKVLPLEVSAPHSISILAGEAQGFTPYCSPRACCNIRPRREWRSSRQPAGGLSLWGGKRWTWGADESAQHLLGGEGDRGDQWFPRVGWWGQPGRELWV